MVSCALVVMLNAANRSRKTGRLVGSSYAEENTGKWRVANFKERKYIVFEPKPGSVELSVRQIGSANPIAQCKSAPEWGGDALHCFGREEFWMDTRNLRFTVMYPHGYWNTAQKMATGGTPFVAIGTCSAL